MSFLRDTQLADLARRAANEVASEAGVDYDDLLTINGLRKKIESTA